MAGRKGRSGGSKGRTKADGTKGKGAFEPALPTAKAPFLGNTPTSVQRHARWVAAQLLAGALDTATAQRVSDCHRTLLLADRQDFARQELRELRSLVARREAAARMVLAHENNQRRDGFRNDVAEYDADVPAERKPS